MLLTDMGQKHHVVPLALAHWAVPPSTKPTRGDLHDTAEKLYGPSFLPGVDEGEPHRLWPAKKIAVGSTGQRNGSFKGISRRLKAKRFSRPGVKAQCDLIKVMLRVDG
jgi:hypothetical protein